jgi:SET domain-containing protein
MTNEYIEVNGSEIHRHGVFAKKDIPKGTTIIEYTGVRITKEQSAKILEQTLGTHSKDPENHAATYIFNIGEEWDLDGDTSENDAKYINHSCDPNCKYVIKDKRIWIESIKDIKKGEEITYNYGFEIEEDDPYEFMDHPCRCGTQRCVGYILDEDEWPRMKELLKNKK